MINSNNILLKIVLILITIVLSYFIISKIAFWINENNTKNFCEERYGSNYDGIIPPPQKCWDY